MQDFWNSNDADINSILLMCLNCYLSIAIDLAERNENYFGVFEVIQTSEIKSNIVIIKLLRVLFTMKISKVQMPYLTPQ